jgi:hypothetical protein
MRSRSPYSERAYDGPERRAREIGDEDEVEPVVLTRKYASAIDGVNLEGHDVGDRLPLRPRDARLLIAEGWAEPTPEEQRRHASDEDQTAFPAERIE